MTEFERGVRFVMEREECYALGKAADERLQFGDYIMSANHRPADSYLRASAEHREKRIRAMLLLSDDRDPA